MLLIRTFTSFHNHVKWEQTEEWTSFRSIDGDVLIGHGDTSTYCTSTWIVVESLDALTRKMVDGRRRTMLSRWSPWLASVRGTASILFCRWSIVEGAWMAGWSIEIPKAFGRSLKVEYKRVGEECSTRIDRRLESRAESERWHKRAREDNGRRRSVWINVTKCRRYNGDCPR